jgi:hypothetical protein
MTMTRSSAQYNAATNDGGGGNPTSRREAAERKKAARYLAAQYAITDMLAAADTLEAALPRILRLLCATVHWHVAELWIVDLSAGVLRCAGIVTTREAAGTGCEALTRI